MSAFAAVPLALQTAETWFDTRHVLAVNLPVMSYGRTPDQIVSFYDEMVRRLEQDRKHVEHVQDFWGDTLTAAGSQSTDGKAAYVQLFLAGNQGSALANEGVGAVRDIVEHLKPPPGVRAYVTGAAPLISDQFDVGSKGTAKVTGITVGVRRYSVLLRPSWPLALSPQVATVPSDFNARDRP